MPIFLISTDKGLKFTPHKSNAWSSHLFQNWFTEFVKSGCLIQHLFLKSEIFKDNGEIYSLFLEIVYITPEGFKQTRSILLRGSACIVVPIVRIQNQSSFLLVQQRRVINGNFSLEFPAGKIETGKTPIEAAQEELLQECGIHLPSEKFFPLSEPLHVCESAFDETAIWFYCYLENFNAKAMLTNSIYGENFNGEYTHLKLVSEKSMHKINNFQIKTGLQLLREKGLINS